MTTIARTAPWFEDLGVGLEFDAPALTLTAGHAALYQALCGDRLALPLDHARARAVTGCDAPLAHPLLAINVAIGQTTWASQRVKGNLGYRGLHLVRTVHLGDTLYTRTRVIAARQNRRQGGRAATGVVALESDTVNQRDERVLHYWRFPMIPCGDPEVETGRDDALDDIGAPVEPSALRAALPVWNLAALRPTLAPVAALAVGQRLCAEARDTVTGAPELVRLTLNLAMAHTDATMSHTGSRLVYGGHTVAIAFAQVTRLLPQLVTLLAWDACDHTAPVHEGDRVRTEVEVLAVEPLPAGSLVRLHAECFAARATDVAAPAPADTLVLRWTFWVWSAVA